MQGKSVPARRRSHLPGSRS